jgi:hypothetical protein
MAPVWHGQRHGHTAFGSGQNAALPAGKMPRKPCEYRINLGYLQREGRKRLNGGN